MSLSCGSMTRAISWRAVAAVALALLPGCSDDGFSPNAGGTGADGGSGGSTGSVSTTVTASAGEGGLTGAGSGDDGNADDAGDRGTAGLSDSGGPDGTGADDEDSGGVAESTGAGDGATGDTGSSSDTGEPTPGMACASDADCVVIDDCCGCAALHEEDPVPACEEDCEAPQCTAAGLGGIEAECVFGQCQLQKVSCNGAFLSCDETPPECPEGMLPSVDDDASCWTGGCVPAQACDVVPDCSWCEGGQACVQTSTQIAPLYACWPVDPGCDGTPSCECMGEVCTDPFVCGDGGAGDVDLGCSCPVCG